MESMQQAALTQNDSPIVVLSDQKLNISNPRVIQISPKSRPQNVGIVSVAARQFPRPQVMVRVRNQSSLSHGTLMIRSNDVAMSRLVTLPASGSEKDEFIDLPILGQIIQARIDAPDDLVADNTVWLVRAHTWPRVEPRSTNPSRSRSGKRRATM